MTAIITLSISLAVAIFIIIVQRRQLWRHEERIQELENREIYPDSDVSNGYLRG